MTTSIIAGKREARPARDAAGWLGLAASPTFAFMAWASVPDAAQTMMCSSAPGMLPVGGMAWMYLLMSLFHLSPWLRLAPGRRRRVFHPKPQAEGN